MVSGVLEPMRLAATSRPRRSMRDPELSNEDRMAIFIEQGHVLLEGVVGSTAYGLAGPESDVDYLGLYVAPTADFHGLHPPLGKMASVVLKDPDRTYHEALKYVQLVMGGNPTVTELLWLEEYTTFQHFGLELASNRLRLLSARRVRESYLGYATSQFMRLVNRGDGSFSADLRKRTAKHARHLLRLLDQGFELYSTGKLSIRLQDPERYHDFGQRVADGDHEIAKDELHKAELRFDRVRTVLLERPDEKYVEHWLRRLRRQFMESDD